MSESNEVTTPESIVDPAASTTLPEQTQPVLAEPEEPEEAFADIFSAYQKTSNRRLGEEGRQIQGTVVTVDAESVFVDIGFKSEGILALTAFPKATEAPKPGDSLIVSVKGRDPDGYYQLSLFRAPKVTDWSGLQKAFTDGTNITGTVTAVVKGGLTVDVGVRAFIPASRTGTRDAAEMEKLVGQEILAKITKLDVAAEDVVLDRRVVTEAEAAILKGQRFNELQEGAIVSGTVRSLTDFGAFIDLGGIDGLLHISDISWTRVNSPADILEVGQTLDLQVLKVDATGNRLSLGLKQLQPHPWDNVAATFTVGGRVRGTVTRIADFGAFVEIAPGVEGLIHLSEMSWSKRIHKATEVANVGDVIEAVILSISPEDRRISLGLKQTLGDPWVEAAQRMTAGSVVEGPVATMTPFGAFITVAEGVQGLVHISEITADRRLNHPSDVLRVGEIVKAQVLEIDQAGRKLRLSIKGLVPTGLDEFVAEHSVGDTVTGRVVSVENGVARVELGEGILVTCTLPAAAPAAAPAPVTTGAVDLSAFSSMLNSKWKSGGSGSATSSSKSTEDVRSGQVRSFTIKSLDAATKHLEIALAPAK
ncbi:small subunit ribosomal protein S1 [Bryocella elongata]|uniref:Small subunit ribosomal protein S1 n=1 Tax=Bryocella elongata TaxID=863522 RepID=A0A1H6AU96_9BACT|nr:S1 RNA-binding domain-containing protein [Bryocella elongata]SEG52208.1 small subunit ribosomal protein S1 [Bryocella elongata]